MKDEHYKKYEKLSKKLNDTDIGLVVSRVYEYIKYGGKYKRTKGETTKEKLQTLYKKDEHLNNIPLAFWDQMAGARVNQTSGAIAWFPTEVNYPQGLSLSERVSLLKHIIYNAIN